MGRAAAQLHRYIARKLKLEDTIQPAGENDGEKAYHKRK